MTVVVADEISAALADGRPVVALETTVYSTLGLPAPANAEALDRCLAACRDRGVVAALTAVVDGRIRLGLGDDEIERVVTATTKVAERDLGPAVARRLDTGVTTVSASLAIAAAGGVSVFATGGIGGVHRDVADTHDVSADLDALARFPLVVVAAGAKAFLDLPRTLEDLETRGVTVVGFGTDELPAFWSRRSGLHLTHRLDTAAEVVASFRADRALGRPQATLVANPVPEADELAREAIEPAIEDALAAAASAGIRGPAVTPLVLARLAEATGGRTVPTNVALVTHNAAVAAAVAAELTRPEEDAR